MILGQLRMGARQAKNAPLITIVIIIIMKGAYWKAEGDAAREIGREE